MSSDQDLRRNWRADWLRSIQQFADDETQRRMWLDPTNTNPHYSFVEYVCKYFDDCLTGRDYAWAVGERLLSEEEAAAVAEFHRLLDSYEPPTDEYDHKSILIDQAWAKVVAEAKQAELALGSLIPEN